MSKMTSEIFREVEEDDLPKTLKTLEGNWPKHFNLHQILTVMKDYKNSGCEWKHSLFLHGDYENGVYLNKITVEIPTGENIFFYTDTTNPDLSVMKKALLDTNVIPWEKKNYTFCFINSRYSCLIQNLFVARGLECEVTPNTMFWFPPNKECKIHSLPEDTFIQFLDGSFAEEMDKNWPHRSEGSVLVLKENLERNFGIGLFRKSDKKLLGSALSNYSGGIFVLYCDPAFRGRGYATIVVQHMVKEIRCRGRIPFCTVILGNTASEHVFLKTGFQVLSNVDYICPK